MSWLLDYKYLAEMCTFEIQSTKDTDDGREKGEILSFSPLVPLTTPNFQIFRKLPLTQITNLR